MPFVARHAERGRLDATSRDATLRSASAHHNRPQTARQPNRRNPIDRLNPYTVDPAGRDLCDAAPLPVPGFTRVSQVGMVLRERWATQLDLWSPLA